jgi:hypothetical protein
VLLELIVMVMLSLIFESRLKAKGNNIIQMCIIIIIIIII